MMCSKQSNAIRYGLPYLLLCYLALPCREIFIRATSCRQILTLPNHQISANIGRLPKKSATFGSRLSGCQLENRYELLGVQREQDARNTAAIFFDKLGNSWLVRAHVFISRISIFAIYKLYRVSLLCFYTIQSSLLSLDGLYNLTV